MAEHVVDAKLGRGCERERERERERESERKQRGRTRTIPDGAGYGWGAWKTDVTPRRLISSSSPASCRER